MSSPSIGVTNVVFIRWTMSWVIRSPSCSASRISRASPVSSGHSWSISWSMRAARSVFCPASLKRSKNTLSRGTRLGSRTGRKLPIREDIGHPFGGPTVPQLGALRFLGAIPPGARTGPEEGWDFRDAARVQPKERVRPRPDRDRALGVVAEGEAGNPQIGRLLLDAARIREDRRGLGLE